MKAGEAIFFLSKDKAPEIVQTPMAVTNVTNRTHMSNHVHCVTQTSPCHETPTTGVARRRRECIVHPVTISCYGM